jgi:hypothetical protein
MRSISFSLFAVSVAYGAFAATGCGQGANTSTTSGQTTSDALAAVENCQDQEHGCFTDGGGQACADALRACLMSVVPSGGGGPPSSPGANGGGGPPSSPPGLDDGGNTKAADPDVGDGGPARPPLPDAAVAALTKPVGGDSGAPALVCVDALRSCLATATEPESCADQARTCLMGVGAHDAGRPPAAGDH